MPRAEFAENPHGNGSQLNNLSGDRSLEGLNLK